MKAKLTEDVKYLLSDIMEMKDRNRKMEEDFSRERLEIKSMIEKQASEITQMHLTQINRLQAALAEEVKRREQAEMARNEVLRGTANIGMDSSASYTYGSSGVQGGSDMTSRLMAEVRKREALEIENKNLLYEMNRYLTGTSHGDGESSPRDNKNDSTMKGSKRSKEGLAEKNRELLSEVEDLTDKVEEMEGRLKKNKELQRRNEALQEQVDEMNQKRDEMETAQKKIKKELSQLSAALEEVERRNRKLADELECQTRKVRDMDDSFRREKDSIKRRGEEEKAEAVGKVTKQKEEMERQLQEQISKMKQLEDNLQALQRTTGVNGSDVLYCTVPGQYSSPGGGYQTSASHHNGGYQAPVSLQGGTGNQSSVGGGFQTPVVQQGRRGYQAQRGDDQGGYQAFGGDRTQHLGSYADTLREEVSSLQALVLDAKKSYEDELKNLEKQRQEMREGFEKEKESLKQCFEDEKSQIETRLVQVETGTWNGVSGTPSGGTRGELGKGMYNPTVGQVKQPRSGQAGVTSQQSGRVGTPGNAEAEYFHARISELENANLELRQRLEQMQGGTSQATSERLGMSTGQRRAIGGDAGVVPRDADKTIGSTFSNPAAQTRSGGEQHRSRLKTNDQDPRARVSDLHIHFDGEGNHARPELHSEWSRTREGGCRNTSEHSQVSRAGVVGSRDHADMLSKIQTYSETIRKMTKEISSLKCERSAVRSVHKEQLKRQERTYEMEKIELREDLRRKHKEEVSRLRDEFDKKLALERKRLQSVIEELKRKVSSAERSAGELQRRLGDERQKFNNERLEIERTLLQSQEELKRVLEGDYRQRMNNEKQKFESTLQALSRQIGLLQEQRKQIQVKLVNSERSRETKTTANQEQMLYSLEQELLAKLSREKRPLEDQITWLQDEVSKLKREKTEIREKLERDKAELEEELERVRESMRTKLLRAREEMERRSSSSVNKVKQFNGN